MELDRLYGIGEDAMGWSRSFATGEFAMGLERGCGGGLVRGASGSLMPGVWGPRGAPSCPILGVRGVAVLLLLGFVREV